MSIAHRVCTVRIAGLIGAALLGLIVNTGPSLASPGCTQLGKGTGSAGNSPDTPPSGTGFDAGDNIAASIIDDGGIPGGIWVALYDTTANKRLALSTGAPWKPSAMHTFSYTLPSSTTDTLEVLTQGSLDDQEYDWACSPNGSPQIPLGLPQSQKPKN